MSESASTTRPQQIALGMLALGLAALGIYILGDFVRALLWAVIFGIAVSPLYAKAERRWPPGRHNLLLPLVFTAGVSLVFLIPLVMGSIELGAEAKSLLNTAVLYQKTGAPLPDFVAHLPIGRETVTEWWQANLSSPDSVQELVGHIHRQDVMSFGETFGAQALHKVVASIFTVVTLFFLFREGETLRRQMHRAVTRTVGHRGDRLIAQLVASIHGTVVGLALVGVGEGVLIGMVYWLTGVPGATLLAAATGIAAMIPMGAPLIFSVAALLLVGKGSIAAAIVVEAVGFIVVFVADHAIRPVLIGGATKLPFIWVLLGILGGVESFGILGLFVGPAVMSALILLWREWAGEVEG